MMEFWSERSPTRSAFVIGVAYAVVGSLWILYSDAFVEGIATSRVQVTSLQSFKGIGFIVVSSILIFVLVYVALYRLTERNDRLELALQQSGLLHRILRHNLRNTCTIVDGSVDMFEDGDAADRRTAIEMLRTQNDRLVELSEKSRYLRDFTHPTPDDVLAFDIADAVRAQVARARQRHAEATISVTAPDAAPVEAHFHVRNAIEELVENAIEHNPVVDPHVWVSVSRTGDDVVCTVEDDGPGLPLMERRVLNRRAETQTEHSLGIGLWLVQLAVHYSNGTIDVGDSDHGGTAFTLAVPAASTRERYTSLP